MNTAPITSSSSTNVIAFPASGKHTGSYAQAREAWLRRELAEAPSHAYRTFCTALFLNFNFQIYKATGELVAWPSWETLKTKFGITESTANEIAKSMERRGSIRVERGRQGARRAVNKYYALPTVNLRNPQVEVISQPADSGVFQPAESSVDSMNSRLDDKIRLDESNLDPSSRLDSTKSRT